MALNVRNAVQRIKAFFNEKFDIDNLEVESNDSDGVFISTENMAFFGYDALLTHISLFESGYMSFAIEFETELRGIPTDFYEAMNEFNNKCSCWKSYVDEERVFCLQFDAGTVNDETVMANFNNALNSLLRKDIKDIFDDLARYFA